MAMGVSPVVVKLWAGTEGAIQAPSGLCPLRSVSARALSGARGPNFGCDARLGDRRRAGADAVTTGGGHTDQVARIVQVAIGQCAVSVHANDERVGFRVRGRLAIDRVGEG